MCGIAGIHFKRDADPAVLERASAHFKRSLHHRGPDHFGVHRSTRAVYANLRLAIVDRSGGDQPIYAPGQGQEQGIVYNGEVYNHAELRETLRIGFAFKTHSDTEVLLANWLAHGNAGFAALNGMFAACFFDTRDNSFTLVRDRFGAKPLYIYEDDHCLAFASELRTLLGLEGLDHSLNPIGFQDYLAYRYNLAPYTQFKRIEKLPAGHVMRWDGQRRSTTRYAEAAMSDGPVAKSEAAYIDELDGLMAQAVKSQLMGEVPIGVLLSGGLDSSAIAAYVHASGARLKAYSIGFPEVNEFTFSREVARHFELDYVEMSLTQDELRAGMDEVISQLDEPIADPACFALSTLAQRIANDVTVVLSGEGGDELFAGYHHHQLALEAGLDRDAMFGHFFLQSASHIDANALLRDKTLPLHHLRYRPLYDHNANALAGMQAFELGTWMPENLMMKADKVLMAHSLEGRFPFLDLDLHRFASTLPQCMKLPNANSSKHVLRRLMASKLPRSVIERRKMGFTVPPAFFLQPLQARLLGAIERLRGQPLAEVLDLVAARTLINQFYAGQGVPVMKLWSLAVLLLWWADVYPSLRARPRAEPLPVLGPRQKLTVYTVLIGAKEALNNPLAELPVDAQTDLDIDWVCITDNPKLHSPVWRMRLVDDRHLPPAKLSRRAKAMPHEYFAETAFSLYVDNTVTFRRLPRASDLITPAPHLFKAFQHATRHNPEEEAGAVACLGYDDVATVCAQMDFYAARRPLTSITPLTTATVMLRSHHHPTVKRFGVLWWESILAFSKRDQLSFDFARLESGVSIDYWPGTTDNNPFVHWHGGLGRHRVQASFDAKRYAWLHRDDPEAKRDPQAHFLARGNPQDPSFQLSSNPVLEYACHQQRSSLGALISPRRHMAAPLQDILSPLLRPGLRFLVVRVQESTAPRAFSADELQAATTALSVLLAKGEGTVLDLMASDFAPDGKIFTTAQAPYDLVLLIGLPGELLEHAAQKLIRLVAPQQGTWVALLTSPAPLQSAACAEQLIEAALGVRSTACMFASQHDEQAQPLTNTVLAFSWERVHTTTPMKVTS